MSKRKEGDEKLRKRAAKKRFTRFVNCLLMQIQWLSDADDLGMSMNVKKNVAMVFRQKQKKSGALTANDRSLLRINHNMRTVAERKKLCNIIGNMQCMQSLPPKVRARLIPSLIYMTVLPGKTVLREGDVPIMLYFIVNGEIEILKGVVNQSTKQRDQVHIAILSAGDYFGDVAFLEDTVRAHTYLARSPTELLAVDVSAYNQILKPHLQKIWNEKKAVLRGLSYFSNFSFEQCVTACKYGNICAYSALDPIYSDEDSHQNLAHFVLSGECTVLQGLRMKVKVVNGVKEYKLVDVEDREPPKERSELSFDVFKYYQSSSSDNKDDEERREQRKMGLKEIERNCAALLALERKRSQIDVAKVKRSRSHVRLHTNSFFEGEEGYDDLDDYIDSDDDRTQPTSDDVDANVADAIEILKESAYVYQAVKSEQELVEDYSNHSEIFSAGSSGSSSSSSSSRSNTPEPTEKYETHFINVGSLAYGAIFGVGEHFEHRVILAKSQVQCFILPRFWLYAPKQNPGNIWNRRKNYINTLIPSREQLFNNFLKTRSWSKFKTDFIETLVESTKVSNCCKVEDIPIFGLINCD